MSDQADAATADPTPLTTEPPPLQYDTVGLLEGICTTRAIRRYVDEPVPDHVLRDVLFAASRAPSGSNRQPFRFVVLTDGPKARAAKALIGDAARQMWAGLHAQDGYAHGSGRTTGSSKARLAQTMQDYVDGFGSAPALILPCLHRTADYIASGEEHIQEGNSIYPACQNLLLAARALGYGAVMTGWNTPVNAELKDLLGIPPEIFIAAAITLGRPAGHHGPVRRLPLQSMVYLDTWGEPAPFAEDPPGTRHTADGPRPGATGQ